MTAGLGAQFARFLGAGAIATGAHYALLIALVEGAGAPVVPASAAGALLGAAVAYLLNRHATFRSRTPHRRALPRFLTVAALAFAVNAGLMAALTVALALPYLLAQALTTAAVTVVTFGLNRAWTFGAR